jgi:hypothetical protein
MPPADAYFAFRHERRRRSFRFLLRRRRHAAIDYFQLIAYAFAL